MSTGHPYYERSGGDRHGYASDSYPGTLPGSTNAFIFVGANNADLFAGSLYHYATDGEDTARAETQNPLAVDGASSDFNYGIMKNIHRDETCNKPYLLYIMSTTVNGQANALQLWLEGFDGNWCPHDREFTLNESSVISVIDHPTRVVNVQEEAEQYLRSPIWTSDAAADHHFAFPDANYRPSRAGNFRPVRAESRIIPATWFQIKADRAAGQRGDESDVLLTEAEQPIWRPPRHNTLRPERDEGHRRRRSRRTHTRHWQPHQSASDGGPSASDHSLHGHLTDATNTAESSSGSGSDSRRVPSYALQYTSDGQLVWDGRATRQLEDWYDEYGDVAGGWQEYENGLQADPNELGGNVEEDNW